MASQPRNPVVSFRTTSDVHAALQTYVQQCRQEHGPAINTSKALGHLVEERLLELQLLAAPTPWPPTHDPRVAALQSEVARLTRELAALRSPQNLEEDR